MYSDVPHPTTATRLPDAGRLSAYEPAASTTSRQAPG